MFHSKEQHLELKSKAEQYMLLKIGKKNCFRIINIVNGGLSNSKVH